MKRGRCATPQCRIAIPMKRIPLCVSCRYVAKRTFVITGTVFAVVFNLLKWKGWL